MNRREKIALTALPLLLHRYYDGAGHHPTDPIESTLYWTDKLIQELDRD